LKYNLKVDERSRAGPDVVSAALNTQAPTLAVRVETLKGRRALTADTSTKTSMKRLLSILLGALACTAFVASTAAERDDSIEVGGFSHGAIGGLPAKWKPLTFPTIRNHTSYALVSDGGLVVVRAEAKASASGLATDVRIDPREYPIIRWRWKIANLLERADLTRKDGDDYPARLYINFRGKRDESSFLDNVEIAVYRKIYGQDPPTAAINYIWDSKAPAGTIAPNAYTARVRMIVVRSGADAIGRWVDEERNLLDDYRAAFGEDPPPIVSVAIMTDTDNTGESAIAWYGDITFRKKETK
jgi:hypothetical protein